MRKHHLLRGDIDLFHIAFKNCANTQLQFIYFYYLKSRLLISPIDFYFSLNAQNLPNAKSNAAYACLGWMENCPLFFFTVRLNCGSFLRLQTQVHHSVFNDLHFHNCYLFVKMPTFCAIWCVYPLSSRTELCIWALCQKETLNGVVNVSRYQRTLNKCTKYTLVGL